MLFAGEFRKNHIHAMWWVYAKLERDKEWEGEKNYFKFKLIIKQNFSSSLRRKLHGIALFFSHKRTYQYLQYLI